MLATTSAAGVHPVMQSGWREPWREDAERPRRRRPKASLNQLLSSANNRAIRSQLWAVYTLEYQRGCVNNCWLNALTSADTTPPIISSTLDAITRSHIASSHNATPESAQEAKAAYGRALASLSQSLSTMPNSLVTNKQNSRAVLIGMLLLGHCREDYSDKPVWTIHYRASERFVKAIGPGAFDTNNYLDVIMLQVTWFLNLLSNLSLRRRMTLDIKTWNLFSSEMCEGPGKEVFGFLQSWFEMIIPIPGLLEDSDKLLASKDATDDQFEKIVFKLVNFSDNVEAWTAAYTQPMECAPQSDELDMTIEEHCFLSINNLFGMQCTFLRQEMGMMWLVSWFARLLTDCTVLRILKAHPAAVVSLQGQRSKDLKERAFHAATTLAKGVCFLSQLQNMTYTTILSTVLEVLECFFAEWGALGEMGWCGACRVATEMRLKRLAKARPRTLCRVREVKPQLLAAVRFSCPVQMFMADTSGCPYA